MSVYQCTWRIVYSVCQPNDIWNANVSRLTVHSMCRFLMCRVFFSTDVKPQLKYMHTCILVFICIFSDWRKHGDNLAKTHEQQRNAKCILLFGCDFVVKMHICTQSIREVHALHWAYAKSSSNFFLASRISYRTVIYEMCDLWISLT